MDCKNIYSKVNNKQNKERNGGYNGESVNLAATNGLIKLYSVLILYSAMLGTSLGTSYGDWMECVLSPTAYSIITLNWMD